MTIYLVSTLNGLLPTHTYEVYVMVSFHTHHMPRTLIDPNFLIGNVADSFVK